MTVFIEWFEKLLCVISKMLLRVIPQSYVFLYPTFNEYAMDQPLFVMCVASFAN